MKTAPWYHTGTTIILIAGTAALMLQLSVPASAWQATQDFLYTATVNAGLPQ